MADIQFLFSLQYRVQIVVDAMQRLQFIFESIFSTNDSSRRQKGVIHADFVFQFSGKCQQSILDEMKVVWRRRVVVSFQLQKANGGAGVTIQGQVFYRHDGDDIVADALFGR